MYNPTASPFDILYAILLIIWSVLCFVLFFKIWGMTNDIKDIKTFLLKDVLSKPECTYIGNNRFKVGDLVSTTDNEEDMQVIEAYENGTYKCKDIFSGDILGDFSEKELKLTD